MKVNNIFVYSQYCWDDIGESCGVLCLVLPRNVSGIDTALSVGDGDMYCDGWTGPGSCKGGTR